MAVENRHMGIVGQSGSGKFELLNHIIKQYDFVIIFDNEDEYVDVPTFKNMAGMKELIIKNYKSKQLIVRYVPNNDTSELNQLNMICNFIWRNRKSFLKAKCRVKFVIPEIAEYALPKTYKKWMQLRALIKRGRKYGIDIIWDTQKLADCDNIIWGQTRFIFIFHVWGNDLHYLRDKTAISGFDGIIKKLGPYEFICYDTKLRTWTMHEALSISD